MKLRKPITVGAPMNGADPFASEERRIPHEEVESRIVANEHFRELDLPVKWSDRRLTAAQIVYYLGFFFQIGKICTRGAKKEITVVAAQLISFLVLGRVEE